MKKIIALGSPGRAVLVTLACAWVVLAAHATAPLDLSKDALFRSLLQKADTALREGKPELARQLYVQAEGQSEELPDADIGQVRADLLAGEFRRASAFALLVSGEHPDSTEALAIGAFLEERAGQTERAIRFLQTSLAKSPDSVPLVGALAEILVDRGRYQDATEVLDGWMRTHLPQSEISALRVRVERAAAVQTAASMPTATSMQPAASMQPAEPMRTAELMRTAPGSSGSRAGEGHWPVPYFEAFPDGAVAAVKGKSVNGVVFDDGSRVVTLAAVVPGTGGRVYVRNGLGRLRQAKVERIVADSGLAILRLEKPYEKPPRLQTAAPVPGRAASVVGFGVVDPREASWPALTAGLVIQPQGKGPLRMDAELPESVAGSPVFDPQGQLIGVIAPRAPGASPKSNPWVIPATSLRVPSSVPPASPTPVPAKELMERVQGAVVVVLIPD